MARDFSSYVISPSLFLLPRFVIRRKEDDIGYGLPGVKLAARFVKGVQVLA